MKYTYLFLIMASVALSACTGPVIMGTDAAIIGATHPSGLPPADTQDQIAEHTSWCYQTMADVQCYTHPQELLPPDQLVNVQPQNLYPVDMPAYRRALAAKPAPEAASGQPVSLEPAGSLPVEKAVLQGNVSPTSVPETKMP